jgi:glycosyltransferase involved in cell wall biosynthesis
MKILVLTSIYPNSESTLGTTPVVHYFCQEWVKQGHKVVVIHSDNKYLLFFYFLPEFVKRYVESRYGVVLPNMAMRKDKFFEKDGVKILRIPMLKIIPFGKFSKNRLNNQIKKINCFLDKEDFAPDVITGHWENPQIDLIFELKKRYCNVKTSVVIHVIKYLNDFSIRNKMMSFDSIGFRNKNLLNTCVEKYKINPSILYQCYSGLPEDFYKSINKNTVQRKFDDNVFSMAYTGLFLKRKYIESIIQSLNIIKDRINFTIDFIGEGDELSKMKNLIDSYKFEKKVLFHGRIPRDKVKEVLEKTQVFVMISINESFGLVYLEAMACGCIVVASRHEGFDGIIKDGINGFLCKAGDELELSQILLKINGLTTKEKKNISANAIDTVSVFTNENVSKEYLKNIMNVI